MNTAQLVPASVWINPVQISTSAWNKSINIDGSNASINVDGHLAQKGTQIMTTSRPTAAKAVAARKHLNLEAIPIELLFELTLKPERGSWNDGQPNTSPEGRVGPYLASGTGTAEGPNLQGTVSWDLFEDQEHESIHPSDMIGLIETNDGAQIAFETIGVYQAEDADKMTWRLSAAARFRTADERYEWLITAVALWNGTFDYETNTGHFQVWAQGGGQ